jgi:phosphoribosyl 1,2-cyclic phosphodiesterase
MKFKVLASGSKGNCTYVETSSKRILIDIGTTSLNIEKKLRANNIEPDSIDAILITHTHVDHVSGLKVFSKKYSPIVYMTEKMEKELSFTPDNLVNIVGEINLDELRIIPIKISHDVEDANGYIVEDNNSSLVYITDTGYVNEKYHDLLKNKNAYIFESNHDVEKLMNNPKYPHQTKIRILSDKGHLSNKDSAYYLSKFIGNNTKYVVLAHLSEENNCPELATSTLVETLNNYEIDFNNILVAQQSGIDEVFEV